MSLSISSNDTIFAQSTGVGRAAIAIIRVCGAGVPAFLEQAVGAVPPARRAVLRSIRGGAGQVLDRGIVIYFAAPQSETGEPMCELHIHGGRAVVAAVLADLARRDGFRPADAGEFARRALLNGKKDLLDLEALADLIDAETEAQRVQALHGAQGGLRIHADAWRRQLLDVLMQIEAEIDFSDQDSVGGHIDSSLQRQLSELIRALEDALRSAVRGERVRDGVSVALIGEPNVGKSSLLNAIARRDVAIVSEIAGTTRDVIDVSLDLNGVPIVLRDTAGIRDSAEPIEQLGIERSRATAKSADIVLRLVHETPALDVVADGTIIDVWTKSDLVGGPGSMLAVSVRDHASVDRLLHEVSRNARQLIGEEPALVTRERQKAHIEAALSELRLAVRDRADVEVSAEHVRSAVRALERLVGRIDVEDVLGAIFSRFCIGK